MGVLRKATEVVSLGAWRVVRALVKSAVADCLVGRCALRRKSVVETWRATEAMRLGSWRVVRALVTFAITICLLVAR